MEIPFKIKKNYMTYISTPSMERKRIAGKRKSMQLKTDFNIDGIIKFYIC